MCVSVLCMYCAGMWQGVHHICCVLEEACCQKQLLWVSGRMRVSVLGGIILLILAFSSEDWRGEGACPQSCCTTSSLVHARRNAVGMHHWAPLIARLSARVVLIAFICRGILVVVLSGG